MWGAVTVEGKRSGLSARCSPRAGEMLRVEEPGLWGSYQKGALALSRCLGPAVACGFLSWCRKEPQHQSRWVLEDVYWNWGRAQAGPLWLTKKSEEGGLGDRLRGFALGEQPLPTAPWLLAGGDLRDEQIHAHGGRRGEGRERCGHASDRESKHRHLWFEGF